MPEDEKETTEQQRLEKEQLEDLGTVWRTRGPHAIHCLTVIGQIEGHVEAIAQQLVRALTEYFGLPFIYPQLVRTGVVTTEGSALRLRSYPGIDGETVGSIPNGESVQVYGSFQGWYSVGYDDQLGYAAQAYIAV